MVPAGWTASYSVDSTSGIKVGDSITVTNRKDKEEPDTTDIKLSKKWSSNNHGGNTQVQYYLYRTTTEPEYKTVTLSYQVEKENDSGHTDTTETKTKTYQVLKGSNLELFVTHAWWDPSLSNLYEIKVNGTNTIPDSNHTSSREITVANWAKYVEKIYTFENITENTTIELDYKNLNAVEFMEPVLEERPHTGLQRVEEEHGDYKAYTNSEGKIEYYGLIKGGNSSNNWTASISGLPKYDSDGHKYYYFVYEQDLDRDDSTDLTRFDTTYSHQYIDATESGEHLVTITNTIRPEYTWLQVQKVWDNVPDDQRTTDVSVVLYRRAKTEAETVEPHWYDQIDITEEGLRETINGQKYDAEAVGTWAGGWYALDPGYDYFIAETNVNGDWYSNANFYIHYTDAKGNAIEPLVFGNNHYFKVETGAPGSNHAHATITNSSTEVDVTKLWTGDTNGKYNLNGTEYSISDLVVDVQLEQYINDGETSAASMKAADAYNASKVMTMDGQADTANNGNNIYAKYYEDSNWHFTWRGLPAVGVNNGEREDYTYKVKEIGIYAKGDTERTNNLLNLFKVTYGSTSDGLTITNHIEKPEIKIAKIWDDNLYSVNRPDSVTFELLKGDEVVKEIELTSADQTEGNSYRWEKDVVIDVVEGTYTLREKKKNADYHYDFEAESIQIRFIDGELQVVDGTDTNGDGALTATNHMRGSVTITKEVVDQDGNKLESADGYEVFPDAEFAFKLYLKDGEGKEITGKTEESGDAVWYRLLDTDGTNLKDADGNEIPATVINSEATFTLKAGQSLRLINVPAGTKYKVEEFTIPEGYAHTGSDQHTYMKADLVSASKGDPDADGYYSMLQNAWESVQVTNTYKYVNIGINKVDANDTTKKLQGAKFKLCTDAAGTAVAKDAENKEFEVVTTGTDGTATFDKVPDGTYYLIETEAPADYTVAAPIKVVVENSKVSYLQDGNVLSRTGDGILYSKDNNLYTLTIVEGTEEGQIVDTTDGTRQFTLDPHKQIDYLGDGGNDSADLTVAQNNDANAKMDLYRLYLDATLKNKTTNANIIFVEDWSTSMTDTDMGNGTRYDNMVSALTREGGFVDSVLQTGSGNALSVVKFSDWRETHYNATDQQTLKDGTGVVLGWTKAEATETANNAVVAAAKNGIDISYRTTPKNEGDYANQWNYGYEDYSRWTNYTAGLDMITQQIDALDEDRKDYPTYVFFMSDGLPTSYGKDDLGGYIPEWARKEYKVNDYWSVHYNNAFIWGKEKYQNLVSMNDVTGVLEATKTAIDIFKTDNPDLIINAIGFADNMSADISAEDAATFHQGVWENQYGSANDPYLKVPIVNQSEYLLPSTNGNLQYNSVLRYLADNSGSYAEASNGQELADALNKLLAVKTVSDVTISDTLSDYVELYANQPDFAVTKTVQNEDGTKTETKLIVSDNGDNTYTVKDGDKTIGTITWTPADRLVALRFVNDFSYDDGDRYELSFNVEASTKAYEEYAKSGYGRTKGDTDTDHGDNETSSAAAGFFTNKEGTLSYKYANEDKERKEYYPYPVIQVGTTRLEVKKVWRSDDASSDAPSGVTFIRFNLFAQKPGETEKTQIRNPDMPDGSFVVRASDSWTLTVDKLDPKVLSNAATVNAVYEPIVYTVEEVGSYAGYTTSYSYTATETRDGSSFTNTTSRFLDDASNENVHQYYVPDVTDLTEGGRVEIRNEKKDFTKLIVSKSWDNDGVTTWPADVKSVTVGLYQSVDGKEATAVQKDSNPWTIDLTKDTVEEARTFSNLPTTDSDGKAITYTVKEISLTKTDDTTQEADADGRIDGYAVTVTTSTEDSNDKAEITNTKRTEGDYQIEITKYIVDEDGNQIGLAAATSTSFKILRSTSAEAADVVDLNVGAYTTSYDDMLASYTGEYASLTVPVQTSGYGYDYVYKVLPGMYTMEEDRDSIPQTVVDSDGNKWEYVSTHLETEYAWRQDGDTNKRHFGDTHQKDSADRLIAVPEIVGIYGKDAEGNNLENKVLDFFAVNVYRKTEGTDSDKMNLEIQKSWKDGEDITAPESGSVGFRLHQVRTITAKDGTGKDTITTELDALNSGYPKSVSVNAPDWKTTEENLPLTIQVDDNTTVTYSYYLEEVSRSGAAAAYNNVSFKDNLGGDRNHAVAASEKGGTATIEVTNEKGTTPPNEKKITINKTWLDQYGDEPQGHPDEVLVDVYRIKLPEGSDNGSGTFNSVGGLNDVIGDPRSWKDNNNKIKTDVIFYYNGYYYYVRNGQSEFSRWQLQDWDDQLDAGYMSGDHVTRLTGKIYTDEEVNAKAAANEMIQYGDIATWNGEYYVYRYTGGSFDGKAQQYGPSKSGNWSKIGRGNILDGVRITPPDNTRFVEETEITGGSETIIGKDTITIGEGSYIDKLYEMIDQQLEDTGVAWSDEDKQLELYLKDVTITAADNWTATLTAESGYLYFFFEHAVKGYTTTYGYEEYGVYDQEQNVEIVNQTEVDQKTVDLTVAKKWKNGETEAAWPDGYTVNYKVIQKVYLATLTSTLKEDKSGFDYSYDVDRSQFLYQTDFTDYTVSAGDKGVLTSTVRSQKLTGFPVGMLWKPTAEEIEALTEGWSDEDKTAFGEKIEAGKTYSIGYVYDIVEESVTDSEGRNLNFPGITAEFDAVANRSKEDNSVDLENQITEITVKKAWTRNEKPYKADGTAASEGATGDWFSDARVYFTVDKVTLYDGKEVASETVYPLGKNAKSAELNASNKDTGVKVSNLPVLPATGTWTAPAAADLTDAQGAAGVEAEKTYTVSYKYVVREDTNSSATGYTFPYGIVADQKDAVYTITNDLTDIEVEKQWSGTPASGDKVIVQLYKSTTPPAGAVAEEKVRITVKVTEWKEGSKTGKSTDPPTEEGGSITVEIKNPENEVVDTLTLTKSDWEATSRELPKLESGGYTVVYKSADGKVVKSATVASHTSLNENGTVYVSAVKKNSGVNYDPDTQFTVTYYVDKWDVNGAIGDYSNNNGSITATIYDYNNGGAQQTITLNKENNWSYTVVLNKKNGNGDLRNYQLNSLEADGSIVNRANEIVVGNTSFNGNSGNQTLGVKAYLDSTPGYAGTMTLNINVDGENCTNTNWFFQTGNFKDAFNKQDYSWSNSRFAYYGTKKGTNSLTAYATMYGKTFDYTFSYSADLPENYSFTSDDADVTIDRANKNVTIKSREGTVTLNLVTNPASNARQASFFWDEDEEAEETLPLASSRMLMAAPRKAPVLATTDKISVTGSTNTGTSTFNGDAIARTGQTPPSNLIAVDGTAIELDGTVDATGEYAAWKAKWSNLPTVDKNGNRIYYYVVETSATKSGATSMTADYKLTDADYIKNGDTIIGIKHLVITNTPGDTGKISVSANKTWYLSGGLTDKVDSFVVEFTLYSDEACTRIVSTTNNPQAVTGNGKATWSNLDPGRTYYVKETKVSYLENGVLTTLWDGTGTNQYLTNVDDGTDTFKNSATSYAVQKRWMTVDGNWDRNYDQTVYFHLYRDGVIVDENGIPDSTKVFTLAKTTTVEGVIDADNLYIMRFPLLPGGNYTVVECTQSGTDLSQEATTNDNTGKSHKLCTEKVELTDGSKLDVTAIKNDLYHIKAKKEWKTSGVAPAYYPAVTFILKRTTDTATGSYNWSSVAEYKKEVLPALPATATDTERTVDFGTLPHFDENGNEYTYKVLEETISGYVAGDSVESVVDGVQTFTITNTPKTINLYVHKEWFEGETNVTEQHMDDVIAYDVYRQAYDSNGDKVGEGEKIALPSGVTGRLPVVVARDENGDPTTYSWQETVSELPMTGTVVVKDKETGQVTVTPVSYKYYVVETAVGSFTTEYYVEGNGDGQGADSRTDKAADHSVGREDTSDQVVSAGTYIRNNMTPVQFIIEKIEKDNISKKLAGAEFSIQEIDDGILPITNKTGTDPQTATSNENGLATFEKKLTSGIYKVMETKTPDGYVITGDGTFYIKVENGKIYLLNPDSGMTDGGEKAKPKDWAKLEDSAMLRFNPISNTATVANEPGVELPSAGGFGTHRARAIGAAMVALAGMMAAVDIDRRRRRARKPQMADADSFADVRDNVNDPNRRKRRELRWFDLRDPFSERGGGRP